MSIINNTRLSTMTDNADNDADAFGIYDYDHSVDYYYIDHPTKKMNCAQYRLMVSSEDGDVESSQYENVLCSNTEIPSNFKFTLLMCCSLIALLGFLSNFILVLVFSKPKIRFTISPLYLIMLAASDAYLCFAYILLFSNETLAQYMRIYFLYDLLYTYMIVCFITSRAVQMIIPFWLACASLERLIFIRKSANVSTHVGGLSSLFRVLVQPWSRIIVISIVLTLSFGSKLPLFFIIEVKTSQCKDYFRSKWVHYKDSEVEKFHWYIVADRIIQVIQIIAPFIVLLLLNLVIVHHLHSSHIQRRQSVGVEKSVKNSHTGTAQLNLLTSMMPGLSGRIKRQLREDKLRIRSAVYTMAVICSTHLICNSMHLFLSTLEWSNSAIVVIIRCNIVFAWTDFYQTASDVVNFLFTVASCIRLPIYYFCNIEVRREIKFLATAITSCKHMLNKNNRINKQSACGITATKCKNMKDNRRYFRPIKKSPNHKTTENGHITSEVVNNEDGVHKIQPYDSTMDNGNTISCSPKNERKSFKKFVIVEI